MVQPVWLRRSNQSSNPRFRLDQIGQGFSLLIPVSLSDNFISSNPFCPSVGTSVPVLIPGLHGATVTIEVLGKTPVCRSYFPTMLTQYSSSQ